MDLIIILLLVVLILFVSSIAFVLGLKYAFYKMKEKYILDKEELEELIQKERTDAKKRSKAVIGGLFSEQLAPILPNFPFKPTEVKFLGKPIDYIVFKGLDNKEIEEVIFLEIKSGKSQLTTVEKQLKTAIEQKKVKWQKYTIDKEITN